MNRKSNRLASESSPYLLQHAYNPVDWYPWGPEALEKAGKEDKPLLVSIGYAACHWCHVMEKESFENEEVAAFMNRHFVNVKIDREERPDLDHIYMDAVTAMSGSGGWPLNVFLTPEGKPFYGGTYFPPKPHYNRPSWMDVLTGISDSFRERREEVELQAGNLTRHLVDSNQFGVQKEKEDIPGAVLSDRKIADTVFSQIMKNADKTDGGFGRAPKFPQTFTISFLLHYYYHTKNQEALTQACLSLDKMMYGGIYDQVGGGFARYSTDTEWLVPHFEKMLYDNALLVSVFCEACQLTGNPEYARVIRQTLDFVEREWISPEGGFYTALDADSEGVEGKYYVWSREEADALLGGESPLFSTFYDISTRGNWEGKNILNVRVPPDAFSVKSGIPVEELARRMEAGCRILLQNRNSRVKPQLDDKILLGWNALMAIAFLRAFAVLGEDHYLEIALKNLEFLFHRFSGKDGGLLHTYKNGLSKYPAFLDDYACLIQACILAQECTADASYLNRARDLMEYVDKGFSEEETGFFFYTHTNQDDVIVRKKEVYDGATPSGNSVMALNLYYLGVVFDKPDWRDRSLRMSGAMLEIMKQYPGSFALWATGIQGIAYGIPEIALVGQNFKNLQTELLRTFIPLKIFQSAPRANKDFPLLANKPDTPVAHLYLCKAYSCQSPVSELPALIRQLEDV